MPNYSNGKLLYLGSKDSLEATKKQLIKDLNEQEIFDYSSFEPVLSPLDERACLEQASCHPKLYFSNEKEDTILKNKIINDYLEKNNFIDFKQDFIRQPTEDLIVKDLFFSNQKDHLYGQTGLWIESIYARSAPLKFFHMMAEKNNLNYIFSDCYEGFHTTIHILKDGQYEKFKHSMQSYIQQPNRISYGLTMGILTPNDLILGALYLGELEFIKENFNLTKKIKSPNFTESLLKYNRKIDKIIENDLYQSSVFCGSKIERNIDNLKHNIALLESEFLKEEPLTDKKHIKFRL